MSIEIKVRCVELAIDALRHYGPMTSKDVVEVAKVFEGFIAPEFHVGLFPPVPDSGESIGIDTSGLEQSGPSTVTIDGRVYTEIGKTEMDKLLDQIAGCPS